MNKVIPVQYDGEWLSLNSNTHHMHIEIKQEPDTVQKAAILRLWNREYPSLIQLAAMENLEDYFARLRPECHLFLLDNEGTVRGWLFLFVREQETWFAMILDREVQGRGFGSLLLEAAGKQTQVMNGWAIDGDGYCKADGSSYPSPLPFYLKKGFEVLEDRLETPFSAVKVRWMRKE
jgi:GNAT superfamily N-acetyltransferase